MNIPHHSHSKKVLISGASGLVGTALAKALASRGDQGIKLVRPPRTARPDERLWDVASPQPNLCAGVDAVVNLAGASIAEGRWTVARKRELLESRILSTRSLVASVCAQPQKPAVFLSASAIGIYGARGAEILTEESARGAPSFLTDLAAAWEAETAPLEAHGVRRILLRFGVILCPAGGALQKMLPLFRLGLGGRLGDGAQFFSWIALEDAIRAILFLLDAPQLSGPFNLVAPEPITNAEFTTAMATKVNRPAFFHAPAVILRLALGEFAEAALLSSQRVVPAALLKHGFAFHAPSIAQYQIR